MGIVNSSLDESSAIYIKDQQRFNISEITIGTARAQRILRIVPSVQSSNRYVARRDVCDDTPVEYIEDPESLSSNSHPEFLLKLPNDEDLIFNLNLSLRQSVVSNDSLNSTPADARHVYDTTISGLTFIFASSTKDIEQLVTRDFRTDPNIQKHPNVFVLGDYSTSGASTVSIPYTWKWSPPRSAEDIGGGWRTSCSFIEYDQRTDKLNILATFSFWVQNTARIRNSPPQRSPRLESITPAKLRVPSSQSIDSRVSVVSDSDGEQSSNTRPPAIATSPTIHAIPEYGLGLITTATTGSSVGPEKLDLGIVSKPADDSITTDAADGPVFRATMKSLESKTGTLRTRMKRVLRTAESAEAAQLAYNDAIAHFTEALREAASSNSNAVKPAFDHYFEKIAKEILCYERENAQNLRKLIIEPVSRLYNLDIKQAENKRRDFEEDSKDYYAYVGKYLGQRSESLKEKKRVESDSKYQYKRRTFELKRFDYSSFMHDLHGGRKDQEVLSQLTRYADAQAKGYLNTAKRIELMVPQLDVLCQAVFETDKDFQIQREEREEKRRNLEKDPRMSVIGADANNKNTSQIGRSDVAGYEASPPVQFTPQMGGLSTASTPNISGIPQRTASSKFKGIRDLEDKDPASIIGPEAGQYRKEGLLWSLSRPGTHIDPKGLKTAGWHKFWIVLDQGKLSEYANWKDRLDLHMEPIDLRVASVREARNSDRRFCFEVITPHYTRVYQAPSENDMRAWIAAINNALQEAFESKPAVISQISPVDPSSNRKDIAAVLTGKSSSMSSHRNHAMSGLTGRGVHRHATSGDKPSFLRADTVEGGPSELLNRIREAEEGNKLCADCSSTTKVEWVSINLGIILCIECSGIHRSLGTHISKMRSLTLDNNAFTADIVDLILLIGNRVSNMIWEARLDKLQKPAPHATREYRLQFITLKYVNRNFVDAVEVRDLDELLLTSIKRNEVQKVLQAISLGANLNAQDRSRSLHAVYVALATADPAAPGSSSSDSKTPSFSNPSFSHSRTTSWNNITNSTLSSNNTKYSPPSSYPTSRPATPTRKSFPIAELLLQNGADIPQTPPPIPLSPAARLYLDFKSEQRNGRLAPVALNAFGTSPGRPVEASDIGLHPGYNNNNNNNNPVSSLTLSSPNSISLRSGAAPSPEPGSALPQGPDWGGDGAAPSNMGINQDTAIMSSPISPGPSANTGFGGSSGLTLSIERRVSSSLRKSGGWAAGGIVGGVKALGEATRRS